MKLHKAMVFIACLATSVALAIPGRATADTSMKYPYTLVDPGTFGGPQSFLAGPAIPLTKNGALLLGADTTITDDDYPACNFVTCFDPYLVHAGEWQKGHLTDLGALSGNNSSGVFEVNGNGIGAGGSEDGIVDPYTGGPAVQGVLFTDRQLVSLGILPGGYESLAIAINDRGQASGFSQNGVADPFSLFGWGTQVRSVLWQNGGMSDLGTLGGPDAVMTTLNAGGEIAGSSYINDIPNPTTGIPTLDPFLWANGSMRDLGTLGGTLSFVNWMNDRGEVVGQSDLAGDLTNHPFLWDGTRLVDLGTFGGDNGVATWVNGAGDVVGKADLPDGTHHAFLWKSGTMDDLPPIEGGSCSYAASVNNSDQVVGNASDCVANIVAPVLWDHGSAFDLNTLIAPSDLHLTEASYVDDRGDIVGLGVLPNGDQHAFLLIPNGHGLLGAERVAPERPGAPRPESRAPKAWSWRCTLEWSAAIRGSRPYAPVDTSWRGCLGA